MDSPEFSGLKESVIWTQKGIYSIMVTSSESFLGGEYLLNDEDEGYVEEEDEVNDNLEEIKS